MFFLFVKAITLPKSAIPAITCKMCTNKVIKAKKNLAKKLESYDFSESCKQISTENLDLCKTVAQQTLKTFVDMSTPTSVCKMITMCNYTDEDLSYKQQPSATVSDLSIKSPKCQYATKLIDYILGNGFDNFTIPAMKKNFDVFETYFKISKAYANRADQNSIKKYLMILAHKHTPEELVKIAKICTDSEL